MTNPVIINSLVTSQATMMAPKKPTVLPDLAAQSKALALKKAQEIASGKKNTNDTPKSFDTGAYDLNADYLPYNPKKGKRAGKALVCVGWKHSEVPFFNVMLKYRDHMKIALLVIATVEAGGGEHLKNCILAEINTAQNKTEE